MENMSYDALVEMITKEVIKTISQNTNLQGVNNERYGNNPKALVIGSCDSLPQFAAEQYRLSPLEDYKGDISSFECVFITKLSCSELVDCASGKDSNAVCCAVTNALLHGKKVYLLESSLPHRSFSETANRNFYKMFEGYVNTLRSFGVEFIPKQWHGKNLNCNAIADNTADKVITEKIALLLCEKSDGTVHLRKGTVITPSARDVFNHSGISVEFV